VAAALLLPAFVLGRATAPRPSLDMAQQGAMGQNQPLEPVPKRLDWPSTASIPSAQADNEYRNLRSLLLAKGPDALPESPARVPWEPHIPVSGNIYRAGVPPGLLD
jgi:hypothetical protein